MIIDDKNNLLEEDCFFNEDCNLDDDFKEFSNLKFEKKQVNIDDCLKTNESNFFVSASSIYTIFMRFMHWIMRHTYLIVVVYIAILFFIKLEN